MMADLIYCGGQLRRLELIEALPPTQQTALLRTIDAVLQGARVSRRG